MRLATVKQSIHHAFKGSQRCHDLLFVLISSDRIGKSIRFPDANFTGKLQIPRYVSCRFSWFNLWSADSRSREEIQGGGARRNARRGREVEVRFRRDETAVSSRNGASSMLNRAPGTSAVVVAVLERTLSRGWQLDVLAARVTVRSSSSVELGRDESLASPRVRDTPSVISGEDYCANRVVISSDAVMGCSSRSFFLTTLLLAVGLLSIALFAEISCATRKSDFISFELLSRMCQ